MSQDPVPHAAAGALLPPTLAAWGDPDIAGKAERLVAYAQARGADQTAVHLSMGIGLTVDVRQGETERLAFAKDKGAEITLYQQHRRAHVETSDWSEGALQAAVDHALRLVALTEPDPAAGLADTADLATEPFPDLDLYHPWPLSLEEATTLARTAEAAGLQNPRIKHSDGTSFSSHQSYSHYANSHGFSASTAQSQHQLCCALIAEAEGHMEQQYYYTTSCAPEDLEDPTAVGQEAARRVLSRLSPRTLKTQVGPILLHAECAVSWWSAFLSAINGGRLYRQTTFLTDALGQALFPEWLQIQMDPFLPRGNASCAFDAEGVRPHPRALVQDGILTSYILSSYTGRRLGLPTTGNAGGLQNVWISGTGTLEALQLEMHTGLLVTDVMGMGVDLVAGTYSQGAAGFWVEQGQIQYPVHQVTIAGNLRDLFRQIQAVGADREHRGAIYTGSVLIDAVMIGGT